MKLFKYIQKGAKMGSKRKKFVNGIVSISLFTTGLFALGSILFSMRQGELSEYLESSKNQKAFNVISKLDQKGFQKDLKRVGQDCNTTPSCIEIAQVIIKLKNRAIDYEIFLTKTLRYSPDSTYILDIREIIKEIEKTSKLTFGITLEGAKKIGIGSAGELADYGFKHEKWSKPKFGVIIDTINIQTERLAAIASQATNLIEKESNEINQISNNLASSFYLLVASEIILFVLVNGIDFVNNNADPESDNEFNFKKIQPKVKPLSASLLFAFIIMLLGQILLRNEGKQELISNCRDNTMQSINIINSIKAQQIQNPIDLLPLMYKSDYCEKYISEDALNSISVIEKRIPSQTSLAIELKSEALRVEADEYQDRENELSDFSKNSLFSILILNVLALSFLAIHLKIDSDDIG